MPGYTSGALPELDETEAPSPTAAPSSAATSAQPEKDVTTAADQGGAQDEASPWRWGVPLLLVLLVLVLLAPRAVRARQRHQRTDVAAGGGDQAVEAAWAEVRAQLLDLGHTWPERATLRTQQRQLAALLARPPVAGRGSERRARRPDRPRWWPTWTRWSARSSAPASPPYRCPGRMRTRPGDAQQSIVAALWARTETRERRRARWWPRSSRAVLAGVGRSRRPRAEQTAAESGDQVKV